jgi:RNA polymerase sigma-70 factor (ECF subfamily)
MDLHWLFTEYRDGVFRYLCRVVRRPDAASDLTQEVFLRVARAGVPGDGELAVRAWVFKIARNLALNHLRDEVRRPAAVELVDGSRPATQEISAAIAEALADLPAIDRDVFLMRESAGLSYEEIAAACELSADAVRSRLHRTRQQLRASLGDPLRVQINRGVRLILPERTQP